MPGYKAQAVAPEEPMCRLERIATDVTDRRRREALFAADAARHGIRRWLLDCSAIDLAREMGMDEKGAIESVRAPDRLDGAAILDAVQRNGWGELRFRSYSREAENVAADRIAAMRRPYVEKGIPIPEAPVGDISGIYLFGTATSSLPERQGPIPLFTKIYTAAPLAFAYSDGG